MWLSAPAMLESPQRSPRSDSERLQQQQQQLECMVLAAQQHLVPDAPSSSSRDVVKRRPLSSSASASRGSPRAEPAPISIDQPLAAETDVVSLDAHMESFPLVPLPLIPRLSLADLRKCERGLLQLLKGLGGSDEDAQLGKYAGRQLSLVQRHVEQARARERVLQLLHGDVISAPIRRLAPAKALPIFLTPAPDVQASSSSSAQHNSSSSRSDMTSSLSSGNVGTSAKSPQANAATTAKKRRDAIESARAMVRANLSNNSMNSSSNVNKSSTGTGGVSAFVISAGDHSSSNSNKRRRRKLQTRKKLTPAEVESARALQLEKERERRRQEAYQRLIARQELQGAKKRQQRVQADVSAAADADALTPTAQDKGADTAAQPENSGDLVSKAVGVSSSRANADSESESDGSDVSNCSDSDEANEKAIMALQVPVKEAEVDALERVLQEEGEEGDGGSESGGADEVVSSGDDDAGDNERHGDPQAVPARGDFESEEAASHSSKCSYDRVDHDSAVSAHCDCPEVEDGDDGESECTDSTAAGQNAGDECEDHERRAEDLQRREEEQIAYDIQEFISFRKTAMMEQLQQQKQQRRLDELQMQEQQQQSENGTRDARARDQRTAAAHGDSLYTVLQKNQSDDPERTSELESDRELADPRSPGTKTVESSQQDQRPVRNGSARHTRPTSATHSDKKLHAHASLPGDAATLKQQRRVNANRIGIPRAPAKPCKDYRAYFSNFHCILTSVFEQRHAFNSSNSSSSSSLLPRDSLVVAQVPVSEQSLRIQLKLYEGWQSIIHDYATVFGGNIATPRSMLPSSSASLSPSTAHYRINSTTRREVCDIVVTALEKLGDWDEHPSGLGLKTTWNLLWTWSKPRVERKTLLAWQKVNHFQHAKALTRKDCLKKNMGKYLAMGGKMKQAYDVVPLTFILPHEYIAFVQAFQDKSARLRRTGNAAADTKNIWIMKPVALSRGRGISLINDLSQVVYGEQVVIQEYIANPLLLDGYKFDLRLYVLVTSFNPLEAFFYDEGFVRICTRQYEDADLSNLFVHLTNSSIQKENQDAIESSDNPINAAAGEEAGGTKMTLAYLWKRLEAMGADVEKVKSEIIDVILKSLLCGEDHIPFQVNSFDLYGYDILLDDAFRPWLIEINSSPSMARENDLDYQVKDALILDTIKLVDPLRFDRAKFVDVVARRLQDLDSEKKRPHAHTRHPKEAEELAVRQLSEDLTEILQGKVPRGYGELPEHLGSYRRICPHTTSYNQLVKLKKSCVRMERKV